MTEQHTEELLEQLKGLLAQNRLEEVLSIHDEMFERYQVMGDEGILQTVAALDEVVRRKSASNEPQARELVVKALSRKGGYFEMSGQPEEILAVCSEMSQWLGSASDSDVTLLRYVSNMCTFRSLAMRELNRLEEELAAYDELIRRLARSSEPEHVTSVTHALFSKASRLKEVARYEEALPVYEEVLRRFEPHPVDWLSKEIARAGLDKAVALELWGRHEEALAAYDEADRRFGARSDKIGLARDEADQDFSSYVEEDILMLARTALMKRGDLLARLGRTDDALVSFDTVVQRAGSIDWSHRRWSVAEALLCKATLLAGSNRSEESRRVMNEAFREFDQEPWALVDATGRLLHHETFIVELGMLEQALSLCEEVLGRYASAEQEVKFKVMGALDQIHLGLLREAKRLWQENRDRALVLLDKAAAKVAMVMDLGAVKPHHGRNLGYIAFLQGRRDEARKLITESVQRSDEVFRSFYLQVPAPSVPEDAEFLMLMRSLLQSIPLPPGGS
jgi:tetratricopeptide (TPR) repeat protein